MKKHKDLVHFLKSKGLRMTPSKEVIIQYFLDNKNRHIPFKDLQKELYDNIPDVDRVTIYRNIEKFVSLGIIQELDLPKKGKIYQYVFEKKVPHYFICKSCGKTNKGNEALFNKIELALKEVPDFSKANLSLVFYGFCSKCETSL
ncbi:MAG: transcriptional repressor [Pseudobdellovibrio sp.]|nr:transcriptional repressor [Pseudobdellovibrio sp.]